MSWKFDRVVVAILFTLIAAGCAPATPIPSPPGTGTPASRPVALTMVPVIPLLPDCSLSLQIPNPLSPRGSVVTDSLTPKLTWDYSGSDCYPSHFAIEIYEQAEEFGTKTPTLVLGTTTSFELPVALKPATAYIWRVRAVRGTELSPLYGGSDDLGAGWVIFYTGPLCNDAMLVPPMLDSPADSSKVIDGSGLKLTWHYPDACLPGEYRPQIASDSTFTNVVASWTGTGPSVPTWNPLVDLMDCTRYYWRVGILRSDKVTILYSESRSFFIDRTATCSTKPMSLPLPSFTSTPVPPEPPTATPQFACSAIFDEPTCSQQYGNYCQWTLNQNQVGACINQ
jgi:hypothetical protein